MGIWELEEGPSLCEVLSVDIHAWAASGGEAGCRRDRSAGFPERQAHTHAPVYAVNTVNKICLLGLTQNSPRLS